MARLLFVLGIVAVTFMIYSLVDAVLRPAGAVRALPKWLWVVVIILLPVLGGALWFFIGRGQRREPARSIAPDDDPDFLGLIGHGPVRPTPNDPATDERIRDLERRLAELDDKRPGDDPTIGRSDRKPGPAS